MSPKINGFTLIELLLAIAVIGILSVLSVNLLFATTIGRARQGSIQYASEDVRNILALVTKSVKEAESVNVVSATKLQVTGDVCRTYQLTGTTFETAQDSSVGCVPPTSNFTGLTDPATYITTLNFTVNNGLITVLLVGYHTDAYGKHNFSYMTYVKPRLAI